MGWLSSPGNSRGNSTAPTLGSATDTRKCRRCACTNGAAGMAWTSACLTTALCGVVALQLGIDHVAVRVVKAEHVRRAGREVAHGAFVAKHPRPVHEQLHVAAARTRGHEVADQQPPLRTQHLRQFGCQAASQRVGQIVIQTRRVDEIELAQRLSAGTGKQLAQTLVHYPNGAARVGTRHFGTGQGVLIDRHELAVEQGLPGKLPSNSRACPQATESTLAAGTVATVSSIMLRSS